MTNSTEYQECMVLAQYLGLLLAQKKIKAFSHIPNGTYTPSWNAKIKNKRLGVDSGVPDYLIVLNDKLIMLEMKRKKGYKVSASQQRWLSAVNSVGVPAYVCAGFDEAKKRIDENIAN